MAEKLWRVVVQTSTMHNPDKLPRFLIHHLVLRPWGAEGLHLGEPQDKVSTVHKGSWQLGPTRTSPTSFPIQTYLQIVPQHELFTHLLPSIDVTRQSSIADHDAQLVAGCMKSKHATR